MAKPRKGGDSPPIRFENLDGSPADLDDDSEMVDPLELDTGERVEPDDPRANDPFAEDDDDEPDERKAEADADRDDGEADEREEDDDDLRKVVEEQRARIAELEQSFARDRDRAEAAAKELSESRLKQLDQDIAAAEAALEQAIEDGDAKEQVKLNSKLYGLQARKETLSSDRPGEDGAGGGSARQDAAGPPPRVVAKSPEAERWMRGRAWVNNPAYAAQNNELIRVAKALAVEDGYDPNDREYYVELERRLKRKHPELFSNGHGRQPGRQAVGRVSRDDPPRPSDRRKSTVLTAEDQRNMMRFQLDPRNKDHVREYLRSRVT